MTRLEEIKTVAYEKDRELCSSYQSFVLGAVWADEHPRKGLVDIDKVCDWLKKNSSDYPYYIPDAINNKTIRVNLWDDLRKEMEE